MKNRKRSVITVAALLMALCMLLCSCELPFDIGGKGNNTANTNTENTNSNTNENVVPPEPEPPMLVQKIDDVIKWANDSLGIWELLGYMFPDHAVYRISGEGYILEPVNEDLPRNSYDWTRSSEALRGIDVSTYQKDIDWAAVADSGQVDFAFIRLGYRGYGTGKMVKDNKFDANARGALSNGIPIGVYFVTKAIDPDEAVEEAEWILDRIKGLDVTWPIVMDFEPASGLEDRTWFLHPEERSDIIIAFCERIMEAGYTPMIYGNIGTFMTTMDMSTIGDYPKWFAQYFNSPHFPYAYQIWQAKDNGSIPGIETNVDIDYAMFDFSTGEDVLQPDADEDPQANKAGQ